MPNLLPMLFIVLGALALIATLYFLWQSIREALEPSVADSLSAQAVSSERAALLAEKHSLLLALKDIEGEHQAGKLSAEDFAEFSQRYRSRAREVMRQLDEQLAPHRAQAKALLEAGLQLAAKSASVAPEKVPDIQADTQAEAGTPQASYVCEKCGTSNDSDALFCKKCGARVSAEASS